MVLVLIVDLVVGTSLGVSRVLPGPTAVELERQAILLEDLRESPALPDEPWVDEYVDDWLDRIAGGHLLYSPFVGFTGTDLDTQFVNVTDGERASYQAAVEGQTPLRVAFFGGSTMFGEGQRDEYTIASGVVRIAEQESVLIEARNFGSGGWVIWQELLVLERLLANGEGFDHVVFYDGFNDFAVQDLSYSADPTHIGSAIFEGAGDAYRRDHARYPGFLDGFADLASAYVRTSAIAKVLDRIRHPDPTMRPDPGSDYRRTAPPEAQTDAALDIYSRAVDLVTDLANRYGVSVTFFWQPRPGGWSSEVIEALPPTTIDISTALDGVEDEVYVDYVHTNERGARLVAEAMWEYLGPELRAAATG